MTGRILAKLNKAYERERGPLYDPHANASYAQWNHWRLAYDQNQIAWLELDKRDSSTNVLSEAVLEELRAVLDKLQNSSPNGLVLRSAKASHFCLGADIREFQHLREEDAIREKLTMAHAIADWLEALPCPKLAVIHGACLGGGLEIALCCDMRLLVPGATLGFPEIRLGLHPGLGGTARLTRQIDPIEAMTLMLTGKTVNAKRAKSLGLADDIVPERHIANAVQTLLTNQQPQRKTGWKNRAQQLKWARHVAARQMRSKSAAKAPPQHYPAPEALITLWENHGQDFEAMRREEIQSFAHLLTSTTAQNLIRIFFLREQMKGLSAPDNHKIRNNPIRQVHVIGAGTMGGDIAGWCALKGLRVSLFDMQPDSIAGAIARTTTLCQRKKLSSTQRREVLDRLIPDMKNAGIEQADLVIEAVPEKLDIKQKVYAEVEPRLKSGAILATNTSSIPLQQLSQGLEEPGRLVGLHFFNPVALMQLVEVVQHKAVSQETLTVARAFVGQIDRLPAPVSSAPGFLVNRALTPYLMEAILLFDEGVTAETIDQAAEDFGMPMGPVELADQVGLDICLSVADMLQERLESDMVEVPQWFRDKVERGDLGRKSGQGFYTWKEGKAQKSENPPAAAEGTLDRLLLPMLNACMACLSEKVIEDEGLLDGAMIFGTGFAPFRGGPMHYARQRGFQEIEQALKTLADKQGPRFTPDPGWSERT